MKKAILVVSFGTTYKGTIEKTIGVCETKISKKLKDYDLFRAFTSSIVIKKVKDRDGIHIENPEEVLDGLYKKGYKEVIVQPLYIIPGKEFDMLKSIIERYKNKFDKIIVGRPLLTDINDYKEIIRIIKKSVSKLPPKEAIVYMGHGTFHKSHSAYIVLESMLRELNTNAYIGTMEGNLNIYDIIEKLRKNNIQSITLAPFMLVAGKHVLNDMAGDNKNSWKSIFESEGFDVKIDLKGLGENIYIQDKFMIHAYECVKN